MENLLNQLNESQREAVTYCDGAQLVIAGAGSGKTRVLTYKIAYLLQTQGLAPWNILALTFTNKAAGEMKERIGRLVGQERARYLQMGTFHAVFARILRQESQAIGFQSNFTIYDQADSRSLVKNIVKEMQLDDKQYKPNTVADKISMAKNHLLLPDAFVHSSLYDAKHSKVYDVYQRYIERCRQSNAMDFDDLLLQTFLLFQHHDDIRLKYADKFRYVLVDEYQDTNFAQQSIVLQLTRERQHVCVVGDDAQSIYAFRGAVISNILDFENDYPGTVTYKLEENYRSTQTIVKAANSVIKKNHRQIFKNLYSNNLQGECLTLYRGETDRHESRCVIDTIKDLVLNNGKEYNDFAILYRQNWLSRSFEDALRKEGIPYRIFGGMSFYQRKEIKDMLAYFRVVVNPADEQALRRIINYPTRGIGDTTLQKLVALSVSSGKSLWEIISYPRYYMSQFPKKTMGKITDFLHLVRGWQSKTSWDAYSLANLICRESGIGKLLSSSHKDEDQEKFENVEELLAGIKSFVDDNKNTEDAAITLEDYIREVSLLTDADKEKDDNTPYVKLMTVHASKGLEFPIVFIVGMDEDVFPCRQAFEGMGAMEEERRLFYVAITRAKHLCFLSGASTRFRNGSFYPYEMSSFIKDIDSRYVRTTFKTSP